MRASTFEIVLRKQKDDPLTYEKPLPFDLLPYAIRSDDFIPIGTAFAIESNQFISAAHVIMSVLGSQYGAPLLRDHQGAVYEIDDVLKFSVSQDFIVFKLRKPPAVKPLKLNRAPTVDTPVFAVGNALGEGIVVRDGLLTSQTPEALDGRWKWLRFSAAASPGSSGGPLLDESGKVLGVVLAASPNENLNYALPIEQALSAPVSARIDTLAPYRWLLMSDSKTPARFQHEFALPKPFAEFDSHLIKVMTDKYASDYAELMKSHAEKVFPQGAGSLRLLNENTHSQQPRLLVQDEDGQWNAEELENDDTIELEPNGSITIGQVAGVGLGRLSSPDDVTLEQLMTDSELFARYWIKAARLMRTIGPESIKVTALGKASSEAQHVDRWGRKWLLRTWRIPFGDLVITNATLPIPGGCVVLSRAMRTMDSGTALSDVRQLTDFFYITYTGTLEEWREYLALKAWHPAVFDKYEIDIAYENQFRFKSPRLELTIPAHLQRVTARSELVLYFAYFLDKNGTPVWDVGGVGVKEDDKNAVYLRVIRRSRPPPSLPADSQRAWDRLVKREGPRRSLDSEQRNVMSTTLTATDRGSRPLDPNVNLLYQVDYYVYMRSLDDDGAEEILSDIIQGLRILE